jgi:hypothetical protein
MIYSPGRNAAITHLHRIHTKYAMRCIMNSELTHKVLTLLAADSAVSHLE